MNISSYLKHLAVTTPRADVLKNIASMKAAYRESAPVVQFADKELGNKYELPAELIEASRRFKGTKDFRGLIGQLFDKAPAIGDFLESKVTSEFETRFSSSGLSYRQANVLMLVEMYAFAHRYALRYMAYLYDFNTDVSKDEGVSRIEVKRMTDESYAFVHAVGIFNTAIPKLERLLNETTEAIVDAETHAIFSTTAGVGKTDPLQLGFVDIKINPFFLIQRYAADREMESYYIAKEEREALRLRIIRLNERGNYDQTVLDKIAEAESQIRRRQKIIDKVEAEYGA